MRICRCGVVKLLLLVLPIRAGRVITGSNGTATPKAIQAIRRGQVGEKRKRRLSASHTSCPLGRLQCDGASSDAQAADGRRGSDKLPRRTQNTAAAKGSELVLVVVVLLLPQTDTAPINIGRVERLLRSRRRRWWVRGQQVVVVMQIDGGDAR